jgi:hypothetical protein
MASYVDLHKPAPQPKKELADHEVFNNALMRAQAAGEKPSAELFAKIDSEYKKKKEKKAAVKSAGIGTTVGILGGLASGRGDDKLRSAGRGAIKGMGFDVGAGLGGALGGALGMATLNPALGVAGLVGGGLGGGMLGQSLASSAIGPYETEEEKFERMLAARESAQLKLKNKEKAAMSLYSFGAKLANVTGMTYDPDNANVKRLKARHPDNWQQIMAQSQGLSDATQAKVIKKAQSTCSPCAMPNAPTNKKPYTSASPAVTDASQKSEEVGKPPVTETEHSEAKAKLPEEGAKSAFAFGAKVAESFGASVANYGGPRNMLDSVIDTGVKGVNAVKSMPGKIWNTGKSIADYSGPRNALDAVIDGGVAARNGVGSAMQTLKDSRGLIPRTGEAIANYGGPRNALDTVIDAGVAARNGIVGGVGSAMQTLKDSRGLIPRTGEAIANYGGPRNALDTVIDAGVAARNGVGSALTGLNNARLSAGRQLGEMWAAGGDDGGRGYQGPPGSTPQVSGKVGPKPDAAGAGTGTGAAGGGILETLYNNPGYTAAGGLGALGLGGLLYYLNSQPKKKKRDEEEV